MEIDIENAKEEFLKYVSEFDNTQFEIDLKKNHSIRVMKISEQIAKTIFEEEEKIKLATLIGLLHDIARFEQWTKYKTFKDFQSIDHGDYGVKILQKENFIRKFIKTEKYDDIILKAIKSHNKFEIENGLNEEELKYAKIIRDADKLDIFYEACTTFWKNEKKEIEVSNVSKEIEEQIKKEALIKRTKEKQIKGVDRVISVMAFVFDLNYKESFKILKKEKYIDKIINQFNFKIKETEENLEEIKKIIERYIERKENPN